MLHTTTDGRRLVRVVNLALQVADIGANVFRFADMDVVVAHFVRQCKFYFIFIKLDYRPDPGLTIFISHVSHDNRENIHDSRGAD